MAAYKVRHVPKRSNLSGILAALAEPTRRSVVERVAMGPATVSELHASFRMALPSFMQHLDVLADAGLIRSTKKGRVRTVRLVPEALAEVQTWLNQQRDHFSRKHNQLDALLVEQKETQT
jgi:DNA-binding transcriptional ArsR family regulator